MRQQVLRQGFTVWSWLALNSEIQRAASHTKPLALSGPDNDLEMVHWVALGWLRSHANHLCLLRLTQTTAGLTGQISQHLCKQPAVDVLVRDAHHMADNCGVKAKSVRGCPKTVSKHRLRVRVLSAWEKMQGNILNVLNKGCS